jgi:CHAD domain-containing protein
MPSRKTNGTSSFGDLVAAAIGRLVDELEATESVVRTDHSPEAIHRMRAASRRLRTALLIFKPHLSAKHAEHAKSALRSLNGALGKTREWDVQAKMLVAAHSRSSSEVVRAAVEHLLERVEKRRSRARRKMSKAVERIDFARLLKVTARSAKDLCSEVLEGDIESLAWEAIEPRITATLKELPTIKSQESGAALHSLRILVKKLCIALELLEGAFGKGYAALHGRMSEIEDKLGQYADQAVLEEYLARAHAALTENGRESLAAGVSRMRETLGREHDALLQSLRALIDDLSTADFERALRGHSHNHHSDKHRKRRSGSQISENAPG